MAARISAADAVGDATAPALAVDPSGNTTAIWHQEPEGTLWAARRPADGPWEPPTLLDTDATTLWGEPGPRRLAMDAAGNALAIWQRIDGSVWTSSSPLRGDWTAPVRATEPGEVGLSPTVALDLAGRGFAVWQAGNPTEPGRNTRILARHVAEGRWEPAQEIQLFRAETGGAPQLALGIDGSAVAVWDELRAGAFRIWSNRYVPAGWELAQPISPQETHEGAIWADVGADASGGAVSVWMHSPGGRLRDIVGRQLDSRRGWGPVVTIASSRRSPEHPRVAVSAAGNALAVWREASDAGPYEVWAASLAADSGWGPPRRLQPATPPWGAGTPRVAVDALGNGVAVWRRGTSDQPITWAARFDPVRGWQQPKSIGTGPPGGRQVAQVAIAFGFGGDAVAAWDQWDGTRHAIWANRLATRAAAAPP